MVHNLGSTDTFDRRCVSVSKTCQCLTRVLTDWLHSIIVFLIITDVNVQVSCVQCVRFIVHNMILWFFSFLYKHRNKWPLNSTDNSVIWTYRLILFTVVNDHAIDFVLSCISDTIQTFIFVQLCNTWMCAKEIVCLFL